MRARVSYSLHDRPVEENFAVRMGCTEQQIGSYGGRVRHSWNCVAYVTAFRASKGQLENAMKAFSAIPSQGSYTSEWTERSSRQAAKDSALVMDSIRKQGQDIAATLKHDHEAYLQQQKASFDHTQQIDRNRREAMQRGALAYTLYAGDEQLVRNPGDGTVSRVTTQYGDHGWQQKTSGEILMTDDNNLNPNLYLRGDWAQLENVNPIKP